MPLALEYLDAALLRRYPFSTSIALSRLAFSSWPSPMDIVVADNALAKKLLGWVPAVPFVDGLHRTIDWYFSSKDRARVGAHLATRLLER